MKNTTKHFLLVAPLVGLFAASCGDNFSAPVDAGPFCVYAGTRYTLWQEWTAKDGCNKCTCSLDSKVRCYQGRVCGDGGTSDALPASDATSDLSEVSDALISTSDAVADKAPDAASADVPVSSDGRIVDVAADSPASDSRLASERD